MSVNVCIIGDSVTWGARLPFRIAWANLLRNHLEKVSDNLISLYDLGIDKDTSRNVLKRFDVEMAARSPELIIFAVGVNDSCYHTTPDHPEVPKEEFSQNMLNLVKRAKKITSKVIIVGLVKGSDALTKPLLQSTTGKCYEKMRTEEYDEILKSVARDQRVTFVEMFDKLNDEDFDDGIHPNINGHIKMYEAIHTVVDAMLTVKGETFYTLVDRSDKVIGMKNRDSIGEADILRVSGLWVSNSKGQILLSKRPFEKRRDPNKWSPTVACILSQKQTYKSAIVEATKNEIGLAGIDPVEDKKLFIDGENTFFCQMFSIVQDLRIDELNLNKDETQELRWFDKNELQELVAAKPFLFVQSFEQYLDIYS